MKSYQFSFNPELLVSFLAIAESGSVSAAAKVLNISQPSVTAHLQKLEEDLGTQLFKRSVSGMNLTASGLKFVEKAKKIHSLIEQTADEISQASSPHGHLKLSASTTIAAHILPPLFAEFHRRFPRITLELDVANTEEVLDRVRKGQSALGLVEGHRRAPSIRLERFMEDELVLVGPLGLSPQIRRSEDLPQHTLIIREAGSGTRSVIERSLKSVNLGHKNFQDIIEIGSSEAIKAAVIAGLGISFLSRSSIRNELALGKLEVIPLGNLKIHRLFHWALPSGGLSGSAAEFYKFAHRD